MAKKKLAITKPQKQALIEICRFIDENGYPPTIKELADNFNIAAPSMKDRLTHLINKGYISMKANKGRSIKVLKRPADLPRQMIMIPVIGVVAAGHPIMAEENIIGELMVEENIVAHGEYFALKVCGKSMVCAGIKDGSLIIVKRQILAANGEIVIALLNGEVTVKRLLINDLGIKLLPENPEMEPIAIDYDDDLKIIGKVVACRNI
ncbi:MAG: transcriptional repressor LexA [Sedimentisphaeraceae bacterium JB056]